MLSEVSLGKSGECSSVCVALRSRSQGKKIAFGVKDPTTQRVDEHTVLLPPPQENYKYA